MKAGEVAIHSLNRLLIAELSPDQAGSSSGLTSTAVTQRCCSREQGTDNSGAQGHTVDSQTLRRGPTRLGFQTEERECIRPRREAQ